MEKQTNLEEKLDETVKLQDLQEKVMDDFNTFLNSDEFKTLDEFGRIKAMMKRLGSEINDPNPNCNKCHGRGWTGRKQDSGEPIMCTCVQPKMSMTAKAEYEQRAQLPTNRQERRRMLKQMAKAQGNYTKKTKKRK